MQQENDLKQTANTIKDFIRGTKVDGYTLAKSISRPHPSWGAFHILNNRVKEEAPKTNSKWKKLWYTSVEEFMQADYT